MAACNAAVGVQWALKSSPLLESHETNLLNTRVLVPGRNLLDTVGISRGSGSGRPQRRSTSGMPDGSRLNLFRPARLSTIVPDSCRRRRSRRWRGGLLAGVPGPPHGLQRPGVAACEFSVSQQAHGEDKGAIEEAITEQGAAQDTLTEPPPPPVPSPPHNRHCVLFLSAPAFVLLLFPLSPFLFLFQQQVGLRLRKSCGLSGMFSPPPGSQQVEDGRRMKERRINTSELGKSSTTTRNFCFWRPP